MIKAGIFDIGGVLLNWNNAPMFHDIETTLGITEVKRHEAWTKYSKRFDRGAISESDFWKLFIKETHATNSLPEESLFLTEFKKRFKDNLNHDVLNIALDMKNQGYSIAILSNTIDPHANFMKTTGLFDNFDEVILSNEVGFRKPEKEIYELTLKKLNLSADQTFFVDDLPENSEGANKVGIHGILFQDADRLKTTLIGLGVTL